MEPIEQSESILEEEHIPEYIRVGFQKRGSEQVFDPSLKYATMNEVRTFQRTSEMLNQKLKEQRPLLFPEDQVFPSPELHFIYEKSKSQLWKGSQEVDASDAIESNWQRLSLKLPMTNIHSQNILTLYLKNLKRKNQIVLQNVELSTTDRQFVRYKYIIVLSDINLCIKILVKFNEQFKVWKEIEVPLSQNRFKLQIHQFNNEQTDISINDFKFHLILKMPFHAQTNYRLFHEGKVEIQKLEFRSRPQAKLVSPHESHCTNDCQLI